MLTYCHAECDTQSAWSMLYTSFYPCAVGDLSVVQESSGLNPNICWVLACYVFLVGASVADAAVPAGERVFAAGVWCIVA
jgi:hypothetical protein